MVSADYYHPDCGCCADFFAIGDGKLLVRLGIVLTTLGLSSQSGAFQP